MAQVKSFFLWFRPLSAAARGLVFLMVPALLLCPAGRAEAHPHVFIDQQMELVFDTGGLAGIRVRWKFDDMFSSMIAEDYDLNRNGRLDGTEITDVKKEAFDLIAEFNYFIFVEIGKKPFDVKFIRDFRATLKNRVLTYEFLVPCHVSAQDRFKKIAISGYDPTFYTEIAFSARQPVLLAADSAFEVKTVIRENPDISFYFGMMHPWTLFLEFRKKT